MKDNINNSFSENISEGNILLQEATAVKVYESDNDGKITVKSSGKFSLNKHGKFELPIDGLPPSIREYIESVCDIYHCPREFVTAAVLATASTAVGKKIKINEGKYKNSIVLWFVLVARSGSNKSYPMKLVTSPLRKIDAELYEVYETKYEEWKEIPSKERKGEEPRCPAIVVDDCTDERRSEILFINSTGKTNYVSPDTISAYSRMRGAIGIYPELKGMFDSKNQYQQGGTTAYSKLLRLFDCEDIKVDRKTGFTMLVRDPFFNIIGDLQTGMLKATFGSELFMTNGLNQRFLFCMAQDIEYPKRSHSKLPREKAWRWEQTIRLLYEGIYHDGNGNHTTLFRSCDGLVSLSESADKLYESYYNSLQKKKDLSKSDYEASIYSKLQIQVLRYAGIVHALEVAEEKGYREDYNILHEDTMENAIRCMAYFERMALMLYDILTEQLKLQNVKAQTPTSADVIRNIFKLFPRATQSMVAHALGVSAPYISKVLRHKDG